MRSPPKAMANRINFQREMAVEAQGTNETFLYVRMPEYMDPLLREELFEGPLSAALAEAGVGEVAGGGSQMGDENSSGYSGVDVYLKDREDGLQLLRSVLRRLIVPNGTVIEEFLPEWQEHAL